MGIPLVEPFLQLLTQDVYGCLKKRFLILTHFKKNFIELDDNNKGLEKLRGKVEEQVQRAREQGEVILEEVSEWTVNMEKTKKEVDDLMQEKTAGESITCFSFSFPNYISRYRLSKRAEEKTIDVRKNISDGIFPAVSVPAPPPKELQLPPTVTAYTTFESRVAVLNEIKDALKENNVVGIHGAGGVGKTTMAAEVTKQLQTEGYIHEFAMAVVSQDPDVKRIQGKLASNLKDFELDDKESEEERARRLWNRLKNGKSNMVILDDIWGKVNLKEIGIPASSVNKDCKLLITSRQPQEVWNAWDSELHVKQIRVEELNPREAWSLFKKHAGDSIESSEKRPIASQVCGKCGGLPVAIRAVGVALRNQDLYGWEDALEKLKNSEMDRIADIDPKLFGSLKLSYEMLLDKEAKKCFLLCCLFPDDFEIPVEELVLHCHAAGFVDTVTMENTRKRVHTLVDRLKSRWLLLDVPDGRDHYCVKVHDVIRDVGIKISKEENESLQLMHGFRGKGEEKEGASSSKEKRKPYLAMWLRKSHFEEEDDDDFCQDAGTLVLQWYGFSSVEDNDTLVQRANKFLWRKRILSLKVLLLYGLNISLIFPSSSSAGGGESLATNLRMLFLNTWKASDADVLKHLGKLKVFRLSDRSVVELPAEMGLLTELLVLDLRELYLLGKIPNGVLSKLTRLEELHLPIQFTKWESGKNESGTRSENANTSELSCLKRLTTLSAYFPNSDLSWANDIFFGKLNRFAISVGNIMPDFTTVSTKVLKLGGVSFTNKFNGLICKAGQLWFSNVSGLSGAIHGTSHGFPYLKKLEIKGCHDLNYLFSEPCTRALSQLRVLEVRGCKSLVSIVGGTEEEILEQDQEGIICFERLEILVLQELLNFVGFRSRVKNRTGDKATSVFFIGQVACPAMEDLKIKDLPNIESIWDQRSYKKFQNLKTLQIMSCEKIESIVSNQGKEGLEPGPIVLFPALWNLEIEDLTNVKKFYTMRSLSKEESFFNHQVACPALEDLKIKKLPEIEYIWDERSYKNFQNLQKLRVESCEKIESIVSNQGKEDLELGPIVLFPALKSVWIEDLKNVKRFYTMRSLSKEESFFNHQVALPALEDLRMSIIRAIENIWDERSYKNFQNLKLLVVTSCEKIVSIVFNQGKEDLGQGPIVLFPALKSINLGDLKNVKRFYTIRSLPSKKSFFYHHQIVYPSLRSFWFWGIPNSMEVLTSRILPQLIDQETKEIREQGNDFQGVLLPSLTYMYLLDLNIKMPQEISITPAEHGISVQINEKLLKGCDKRLFQPLLDAILGFGCE